MKKSAKPFVFTLLLLLIVATGFALLFISVKLNYEALTREKDQLEKQLKTERALQINLTAEYQMVSSEERIVRIAEEELGMVRRNEPAVKVTVSKNKIEEIESKLKKYE